MNRIPIIAYGTTSGRIGTGNRRTSNGYPQSYALYQAKNCHNCPLVGGCHDQKGNRVINVIIGSMNLKPEPKKPPKTTPLRCRSSVWQP